jgi:Protein of unknown function (DUF3300)
MKTSRRALVVAAAIAFASGSAVFAQTAPPPQPTYADQGGSDQAPPPSFSPVQLDQLVSRIALYPDGLLAQVLAAATYPDQIPEAAKWADQHHYLTGQALADAIQGDQLPWDPSVQALLPFPSVLGTMASDMNWTTDLGNAFLASQQDVMDAVQRERRKAEQYGYLRSNEQVVVGTGPYITIAPVDPGFVVVPYYDPGVVFFAPRPGFFVGGGIRFGFGVTIGGFFRPWGWGYGRFDWGARRVFINNAVWGRTWVNRRVYVHNYPGVRRFGPGPRAAAEQHELHERSEHERAAAREGHHVEEEHHHEDHHH